MHRYTVLSDISESTLEKVRKEFYAEFKVDLDSDYIRNNDTPEEIWETVIDSCFKGSYKDRILDYENLFCEGLSALFQLNADGIVRDRSKEFETKKKLRLEIETFLDEIIYLYNKYHVMEGDVWLNALFTIRYLKSEFVKQQEMPKDGIYRRIKNTVDIMSGSVNAAANQVYMVPFTSAIDKWFCSEYGKAVLHRNKVEVFRTEIGDEIDIVVRENKFSQKVMDDYVGEVNMQNTQSYYRWSYENILGLEKEIYQVEDKILFYKTINPILVRNVINCMTYTRKEYTIEKVLAYLHRICSCKSLYWQQLMGVIFTYYLGYEREIMGSEISDKVEIIFAVWLDSIDVINYRMELMAKGLIYIWYDKEKKTFKDDAILEEKCKVYLKELSKNIMNEDIQVQEIISEEEKIAFPQCSNQERKLSTEELKQIYRMSASKKADYNKWHWLYVIMQKYVINELKNNSIKKKESSYPWKAILNGKHCVSFRSSNETGFKRRTIEEIQKEILADLDNL